MLIIYAQKKSYILRAKKNTIHSSGNEAKMRVGFMSQAFSLYPELTVEQNLILHARLFAIPDEQIVSRVEELATRFDLLKVKNRLPQTIPLVLTFLN